MPAAFSWQHLTKTQSVRVVKSTLSKASGLLPILSVLPPPDIQLVGECRDSAGRVTVFIASTAD